jgi:hypothetical protein
MPIQPYQIANSPLPQEQQGADPSVEANQGVTYVKTVSGKRELFFKNDADDVVQITDNGAVAGAAGPNPTEKLMLNNSGVLIDSKKPVSIKSDGSIILADSDAPEGQAPIGITLQSIANASAGVVALFGRNIPGALTGLGFNPGDDIFIDETAGEYTNNPSGFSGSDDSIIRIGVAAAADGTTSINATDLIMIKEVLIRP